MFLHRARGCLAQRREAVLPSGHRVARDLLRQVRTLTQLRAEARLLRLEHPGDLAP